MTADTTQLKLILVGQAGVGKTSILERYKRDVFSNEVLSTTGVDFSAKTITLRGQQVKLFLYDTAGQERYRAMTSSFLRGTQGAIIVYDVTDRRSFDTVQYWSETLSEHSDGPFPVRMLVGNKIDRLDERVIFVEDGLMAAQELGALFMETSALDNTNVTEAFEELVHKALDHTIAPTVETIDMTSTRQSCCGL